MRRIISALFVVSTLGTGAYAQGAAAPRSPAFEVASVTLAQSEQSGGYEPSVRSNR
jgi:hypothetical protein